MRSHAEWKRRLAAAEDGLTYLHNRLMGNLPPGQKNFDCSHMYEALRVIQAFDPLWADQKLDASPVDALAFVKLLGTIVSRALLSRSASYSNGWKAATDPSRDGWKVGTYPSRFAIQFAPTTQLRKSIPWPKLAVSHLSCTTSNYPACSTSHAHLTQTAAARGVLCGPYSRSPCTLIQGGDRVVRPRMLYTSVERV